MNDIKLKVTDREGGVHELLAPTDMNFTLMEFLRVNGLIEGICGGCAECSSCHVYIDNETKLPPIGVIEDMMLDDVLERTESSRLSCQIHLYPKLDGLELTITPKTK